VTTEDSLFPALEALLGRLMLAGVITSAISLCSGLAMFLAGNTGRTTAYSLTLGLFVLMATPVLRVAVAVIESIRMHDWVFVASTVTVMLLLGVTLTLAIGRL
jgi:uncharacterized membrane protein